MTAGNAEYDFVIIGSGFGGSVSALRLSEKGYKVLVIEKGKWYHNADFPKNNWNFKKWLWLPSFRLFGIMKLTYFRHIAILSGVGVGGGSLVYANTLPKPKRGFYNHGSWATLADWETELAPFYEQANFMLGAVKNPFLGPADKAMKAVAEKTGKGNEFEPTRVAVLFGEAPDKTLPDPFFGGKGPERTTCNYCGQCMTGCPNNSKNTLDKNYLHLAMGLGADVWAEQEVTGVNPSDGEAGSTGYEITLQDSTRFFKTTKKIKAKGVIFAGGVLGTVPLLLRLKRKTLPRLSSRLGFDIRSNNEALIGVTSTREDVDFSRGVAIGSILQVDENSHLEPCRYGKGSGAWRPTLMPAVNEPVFFKRIGKLVIKIITRPIGWLRVYFVRDFGKQTVFMLFMQSMESTLQFKKSIWGISSKIATGNAPTAFIDEAHRLSELYADEIGGKPLTIFSETLTGIPSTAHILGGCVMGADAGEGVIDKENRVFGYHNMWVCDGSMISANPGVNPSLSITAIAERAMSKIPAKNQ
jgi:cholesterol oxidase